MNHLRISFELRVWELGGGAPEVARDSMASRVDRSKKVTSGGAS